MKNMRLCLYIHTYIHTVRIRERDNWIWCFERLNFIWTRCWVFQLNLSPSFLSIPVPQNSFGYFCLFYNFKHFSMTYSPKKYSHSPKIRYTKSGFIWMQVILSLVATALNVVPSREETPFNHLLGSVFQSSITWSKFMVDLCVQLPTALCSNSNSN